MWPNWSIIFHCIFREWEYNKIEVGVSSKSIVKIARRTKKTELPSTTFPANPLAPNPPIPKNPFDPLNRILEHIPQRDRFLNLHFEIPNYIKNMPTVTINFWIAIAKTKSYNIDQWMEV